MADAQGWEPGPNDAITDVRGIRVGHWTDRRGATGCTVIRCETCKAAAVDVRGGAPGTRETDVLRPGNAVRLCHAVVLTGGSVFGLGAADGVVRWLAERDIGFPTTVRKVPIVPTAVLFDLAIGRSDAAPGADAGYIAATRARAGRVAQGSVGAGTGATVGKLLGPERCMKGGLGSASVAGERGIMVGALVATNAVGHIVDPDTGAIVAGPRAERSDGAEARGYVALPDAMAQHTARMETLLGQNTTLCCVATNAALDHNQLQRIALQAHDGLARTIVPAHTFADGDTVFAITTGRIEVRPADLVSVGMLTVRAVERAVLKGVQLATRVAAVPSVRDWPA